MSRENWTPYLDSPPPCGVLVEFRQMRGEEICAPWAGYKENLHPQMNAAYLYWRLTGIGKMQLEA